MAILFTNNGSTTLASGITDVATTVVVAAGQGDLFPAPDSGDANEYMMLTLEDSSGNIEVVKGTGRTGGSDSITIVRAQEGTSARAWSLGDRIELRVTKGVLESLVQRNDDTLDGGTF